MKHTDGELLTLLALGEPLTDPEDRAHVASCAACGAEVAGVRRVVAVARSAVGLTLTEPGPQVWAGIRQGLEEHLSGSTSPTELRAHARLTPVQATWSRMSGDAELATDDQGRRLLQVALNADPPASGVRQAWLVHRDDPAVRQSLGVLDGRHGLWTVEHAIDLELYPILEISQQSIGSSEHSGQTIVRGELVTAA